MIKKILKISLGIILSIGILGASYQYLSERSDRIQYPPIGQRVDVGGFKLHIYGMGNKGPVIIMDTGLGGSCLTWNSIQKELSQFARVYTYDRAGYGWSDASPQSRTSPHIVKELNTLLKNAHIPGPYIFVGHSFGGANVRLYANTYPEDVAGVILIDASHENMKVNTVSSWDYLRPKLDAFFGLMRWTDTGEPDRLRDIHTPEINKILQAQSLNTNHIWTYLNEDSLYGESLRALKETPNQLTHKPLTVITAGLNRDPNSAELRFIKQSEEWLNLQKDLASKSTRGKHIIAKKSHHFIMVTEPEVIVKAVQDMIDEIQKTDPKN